MADARQAGWAAMTGDEILVLLLVVWLLLISDQR